MQIRLSVLPPARDTEPVDVVVSAPAGTPLSSVASGLRSAAGMTSGRFHAGEAPVPLTAVLGVPPLVEGVLLTLDRPGLPPLPDRAVELHVVGGPDAGGVHLLQRGAVRIGRSPEAEIRLGDPDLSRLHAEIIVEDDWIAVRDLGSTNGTTLDGIAVTGRAALMLPGALLRVGESSLCLAVPAEPRREPAADGSGLLTIEPGMRVERVPPTLTIAAEAPGRPRRGNLPGGRRRAAGEQAGRTAQLRSEIEAGLTAEAQLRREVDPDPAAVLLTALHRGPRLWERDAFHPDGLTVRLGTVDAPSHITVVRSPEDPGERPDVRGVPVALSLAQVGSLGIVGPRRRTTALVRFLLAQLAVLHSPEELEIVVLCRDSGRGTDAAAWAWTRWLPHVRSGDDQRGGLLIGLDPTQIEARVVGMLARMRDQGWRDRSAEGGRGRPGPVRRERRTVVLIDGPAALRQEPGVARILAEGPRVGIYPICIAETAAHVRNECPAVVSVTGEVTTRLRLDVHGQPRATDVVADLVSATWAERVSRALGPLRPPAGGEHGPPLPKSARLLDLLGLDLLTPAKLLAAWDERPRSTSVVLGSYARGVCGVELGRDTAHLLVLGVPGAGKTETLRSVVAGLAVSNRPDEMALVLVSAVGTPSFGECVELPHVTGAVSGCTPLQLEQVFAVLGSELDRRAELVRVAGAAGFAQYQRARASGDFDAGAPVARTAELHALPRLVVVIDEVAALLTARPGLSKTMADIARQGRDLGVHLVVSATARTGSEDMLFPEIAALTGSDRLGQELDGRVVLRMPGPRAAQEAVGSVEPAQFGGDAPGRGVLRTSRLDPVAFQGAQVSGRMPSTSTLRPTVARQDWRTLGTPPRRGRTELERGGPTDLALLVGAIRRATLSAEIELPPPLWG